MNSWCHRCCKAKSYICTKIGKVGRIHSKFTNRKLFLRRYLLNFSSLLFHQLNQVIFALGGLVSWILSGNAGLRLALRPDCIRSSRLPSPYLVIFCQHPYRIVLSYYPQHPPHHRVRVCYFRDSCSVPIVDVGFGLHSSFWFQLLDNLVWGRVVLSWIGDRACIVSWTLQMQSDEHPTRRTHHQSTSIHVSRKRVGMG